MTLFHPVKFTRTTAVTLAIVSLVSAFALPARAETFNLTIAASHPPTLPFVGLMSTYFKPEVDRRLAAAGGKDKINWREAYSGQLYTYQRTLDAVKDGITDFGWVGSLWEAARLPLQQITFVTPFAIDDVPAILEIMNDLHASNAALRKEWDDANQVYLGATGIGTYQLFTTFPVKSVDDLKGKKINVAGPAGRWLQGTGAIPVDGAIPVFYNNVQNRVVDGVLLNAASAFPIKLHEVAKYVTLINAGAQYVGALTVNMDTWKRFSPETKKIVVEVAQEYSKRVGSETMLKEVGAIAGMKKAGATVADMTSAERQRWAALMPNLAKDWVTRTESKGAPAGKQLAEYLAGVRKRGVSPLRDWDK